MPGFHGENLRTFESWLHDKKEKTFPDDGSKMDHRSTTGERSTTNTYAKSRASTANEGSNMETGCEFHDYTAKPSTDREARIQGFAMLRAILNDPKGEIANSIRDLNFSHTVAERSTFVEMMLTGQKADHDKAFQQLIKRKGGRDVAFIIATWCMLGGNTPSTWAKGKNGQKPGEKSTLTDWGKKMIVELQLLGKTARAEVDICKPYVTGIVHKTYYNYTNASWFFCPLNMEILRPRAHGNAKRAADFSPENPDPAKRRKTTALSRQNQQQTDFQTANVAQPKDIRSRPEQITTNEAESTGSSDRLFAKLSREQLEAMNRDLKSKVERLEKQSAANFSPGAKCTEKPSALEDLVKKASGTLDLVKAGIDLRKDNDHWECVVSAKQVEVRHLEEVMASHEQGIAKLRDKRSTLEGRVSDLRDEEMILEGRVRCLNDQVHDGGTLLEENTKLRADLEASQQETARVKGWLNNGEVEITTRFPDIKFVHKSTMKLNAVRAPESLEDETHLGSVGSNSVQSRKHGKS